MSAATWSVDRGTQSVLLARFLVGSGIELGPGHTPFPLPYPGVTVRYVDRWEPDANQDLFPELAGASFPQPDIVADLNEDRLRAIPSKSEDFVVASHVLEHMANPIAIFHEIHRVLRPGGIALVLLPDRTRTFDRDRPPTPLAHLVAEYEADVSDVSDEHVEDFLRGLGEWDDDWDDDERAEQLKLHRERSIHVHCWNQAEFPEVIEYSIRQAGMGWELVDAVFVDDVDGGIEFGYVLRRPLDDAADPAQLGKRFREVLDQLEGRSRRNVAASAAAESATRASADAQVANEAPTRAHRRWYRKAASPVVRVLRTGVRHARERVRSIA